MILSGYCCASALDSCLVNVLFHGAQHHDFPHKPSFVSNLLEWSSLFPSVCRRFAPTSLSCFPLCSLSVCRSSLLCHCLSFSLNRPLSTHIRFLASLLGPRYLLCFNRGSFPSCYLRCVLGPPLHPQCPAVAKLSLVNLWEDVYIGAAHALAGTNVEYGAFVVWPKKDVSGVDGKVISLDTCCSTVV